MPSLHVDLQEGFDGDEVAVTVDGSTVFHERDVRTLTVIGRAASFTTVVAHAALVAVALPRRRLAAEFSVDVDETPYVGVSLRDTRIEYRLSPDPFGYA
jgi:hypothetical protein